MTEQEKRIQEQTKDAIEVLDFLKKDFENKAKPRCKFARVRAGLFFGIKALEKQIPKKLIETKGLIFSLTKDGSEAYEIICECPNCRSRELKRGFPCKCGQKLDWE